MDFTKLGPIEEGSSILQRKHGVIQEGDLVIVSERYDHFVPLYCKAGGSFQNRFGLFHHDDIIGQSYGSKIYSRLPKGKYVRVLSPTSELWTLSLKHRTQIIQDLDQSMIVFMLGLTPGMLILESGTGSGAMSTSFLRAISPTGHLHTVEFNGVRATEARAEFERNKLSPLVTVYHADICQSREKTTDATSTSELDPIINPLMDKVDAVFLDVPNPWSAIGLAREVLKPNARIGTYSPCFEQVAKTCEALRKYGFHSIRTMEARQKVYDARRIHLPHVDFGDDDGQQQKEKQQDSVSEEAAVTAAVEDEGETSKQVGGGEGMEVLVVETEEGEEKNNNEDVVEGNGKAIKGKEVEKGGSNGDRRGGGEGRSKRKREALSQTTGMLVAKPNATMRGHTAFLTFATLGVFDPSLSAATLPRAAEGEKGGGKAGGGAAAE